MRRSSLAILFTLSDIVQASGGAVLGLLWAEVGFFFLVVVSLFVVRISFAQKTGVFFAYLTSVLAANYATLNLSYSTHSFLITTLNIFVPLFIWVVVLSYFIKRRGKKHS